jgi:uncharacterized protein YndB with AHSA1/START domain
MPGTYAAELTRPVALAPADVWAALEDTSAYRTWWPWLSDFRPDGGLRTGATWRAGIRAPMPYVVAFTLDLHTVDADAHVVRATITGDIAGDASVRLEPGGDGAAGTVVAMSWRLTPVRSFLRVLDTTARPVARWGHDTVMRRSIEAFVRAVEQTRPPWPSTSR